MSNNKDAFSNIYDTNAWGPGSGPGSGVGLITPYLSILQRTLDEMKPRRVVDLGCGYFEPYKNLDWSSCGEYLGVDVVERCIKDNHKYENEKRQFVCADWLTDKSLHDGDLVICKDVLQHLPHSDVLSGLRMLANYRWALITNSIILGGEPPNTDIIAGGCRPLNLLLAPYNLRPSKYETWCAYANHVPDVKLSLWVRGQKI